MNKEIQIGTQITKEEYKKDSSFYTQCAIWCNNNNAHIEDKGTYYEVCENIPYVPTTQEQVAELENQVEEINQKLIRDIRVILNPNASAEEKAQAQEYYNEKMEQIEELVEQINELKN